MKQHKVNSGECLSTIAASYGFTVDMVWNLSENSSLKEKRKDPNTLVPGDIVNIPDRREKLVSCETAKIHKFKLSAPTTIFRLQLFEDEKALASKTFELHIDAEVYTGTTDGDGSLEVTIPANARMGTLIFAEGGQRYNLQFGELQPITEPEGVEARLRNLGYADHKLEEAIRSFQKRFGLTETGEADEATKDKLTEIHDSVCAFPEASTPAS